MMSTARNIAELEYAIMLTMLNFQDEYLKTKGSRVQIRVLEELIEVTLTRTAAIPAEERLARSPEGLALLRQFHHALFDSCRTVLRERIQDVVGTKVQDIATDIDPVAGKSLIVIRLVAPVSDLLHTSLHVPTDIGSRGKEGPVPP